MALLLHSPLFATVTRSQCRWGGTLQGSSREIHFLVIIEKKVIRSLGLVDLPCASQPLDLYVGKGV